MTARSRCLLAGTVMLAVSAAHADDMDMPMPAGDELAIAGIVRLAADAANVAAKSDRLIVRIFHPIDDVQHDLTYKIFKQTSLPQSFSIGPIVDMNGNPRRTEYVVEVYTDRDGDAGEVGEGEIFATSAEPVPLGTSDLILELVTP